MGDPQQGAVGHLGDVIVLMPPLCITAAELDTLCDITTEAIAQGVKGV